MEAEKPLADIRRVSEYDVDVTNFLDQLQQHAEAIETVYVQEDDRLSIHPGVDTKAETVAAAVDDTVEVEVERIGVYANASDGSE